MNVSGRAIVRSGILGLVVATLLGGRGIAGERNQFRGPDGNGTYAGAALPSEWSPAAVDGATTGKNVAWKATVPGTGWSSPIAAAGKVFVTSAYAEGQSKPKDMAAGASDLRSMQIFGTPKPPKEVFQFQLTCLDLATGEILWSKTVAEQAPAIATHPSNTFATESPCVQGDRVFAFFGSVGILAAFDFAGEELWCKEFQPLAMSAGFGTGSSLAVDDDRIYLQRDNEKESTLSAIDPQTGESIWTANRKAGSSWATPLVWKNSKRTEIVASGAGGAVAYDPATGEELWSFGGLPSSASASPVALGDLVFFGTSGPFSNSPLVAVRAGAKGDISLAAGEKSNEFVAWKKNGSGLGMASPIAADGIVYLGESGLVRALDAATGEELFAERLDKAKTFAASPWIADGKLFFLDEAGTTHVLKAGRTFEPLGNSTLPETVWSTPSASAGSLVIRGVDSIYCLRNASE